MNKSVCMWLALGLVAASVGVEAKAQTNVTNSNNGVTNTVPVYTGSATLGNSPIKVSGSNVGIGTTSPTYPLDVSSSMRVTDSYAYGSATNFAIKVGSSAGGGSGYLGNISGSWLDLSYGGFYYGSGNYNPDGSAFSSVRESSGLIQFFTNTGLTSGTAFYPTERMRIDSSGNVGIGTTSPGARLEVDGNIKLTANSGASITFQDGSVQSIAYTGVTCGGDYAESVDVSGERTAYEPGDVLVIDPQVQGKFLKSAEPYSTSVTGIYSTKPGTVGRRQAGPKSPDEVPMAMIGIVPTKVSAENGPIHPGDLLVSSSILGYAMRGTDRNRMLGAVIGKALGNLDEGKGVIEVVVMLQ